MEISNVKKSYARWAPVYDKTFGAVTHAGRKKAVGYINAQKQAKVLEVGVGTGLSLPHYHEDLSVTGVDFSHDMLAKARDKVREQELDHVHALEQMDARDMDFADNTFDIVAAMHIVSVVPEPERVMSEMTRVCKPGGKVVITNHFASETGVLSVLERVTAPLDNVLGWHSDLPISTVLGQSNLDVVEQSKLPPFGMMTFLVQEKQAA